MAARADARGRGGLSGAAYRGRLAPSPTGALHLGNARTFLIAWLRARQRGGALALRLEDLDGPRVKRGAAEGALEDLRWLGLDWDEGPDVGGAHAPYVQSERGAMYREALDALLARGLAYPCICSRKEAQEAASAPHGPLGAVYPGRCRGRFASAADAEAAAQGRGAAIRFDLCRRGPARIAFEDGFVGPRGFEAPDLGDFVIRKATGEAAYQLAVVVDDAAMGVSEVVRADDLLPSTALQVALFEALGLGPPPVFVHVPLVVGPRGRRLAKRHGDTRIATVRERGVPPERLVGLLASWIGLAPPGGEAMPADLLEPFDLARVPRGPLVYDAAEVARRLGLEGPL